MVLMSSSVQASNAELEATLNAERATTVKTLRGLQERDADMSERNEQLRSGR